MEYDFTLKFKLSASDCDFDQLVDRLGEAGCTDALVGIGVPGRIALDFTREASSAKEAILSALADVKGAIPSAQLIEVGPDFVGLTDVAEVVGVSRQNMRKLMVSNASFPPAVHEGSAAIWHLAAVLEWLQAREAYQITPDIVEVAITAMQINVAKDAELVPRQLRQEVRELMVCA